MARPPKNAEGPSATQRMEAAFWDCMKEMPFSEITVRDIVGRAKVNRNSYYYHYESMWDLAQESIEHAKFAALASVLLGDAPAAEGEAAAQARTGFDHLRVLASENGNQRLLEDAKSAVVGEWAALFDLDIETLPDKARSAIDFVFGGVTALLAAGRPGDLDAFEATVESSELLANSIAMLRAELDPEAPSQNARSQSTHMKMTEERVVIERTVEELVVNEPHAEKISEELENMQVNEVLAPHEEALESADETDFEPVIEEVTASTTAEGVEIANVKATPEADIEQEPVNLSDNEDAVEEPVTAQSTQEPAEKLSAESLVERIIEEEMHSEAVFETNQSFESISTQVPEQEMQTQQETEQDNEAISEQEPVNEPQSQEDFASASGIDDVLEAETEYESQTVADSEQEPVETNESKTLPSWESTATSNIEVASSASELIVEDLTDDVAAFETAHAEVPELENGSAPDALDEQAAPVEPTDDESSASDEESQLSFDFLF